MDEHVTWSTASSPFSPLSANVRRLQPTRARLAPTHLFQNQTIKGERIRTPSGSLKTFNAILRCGINQGKARTRRGGNPRVIWLSYPCVPNLERISLYCSQFVTGWNRIRSIADRQDFTIVLDSGRTSLPYEGRCAFGGEPMAFISINPAD